MYLYLKTSAILPAGNIKTILIKVPKVLKL